MLKQNTLIAFEDGPIKYQCLASKRWLLDASYGYPDFVLSLEGNQTC